MTSGAGVSKLSQAIDRILFQHRFVAVAHVTAIALVALSYWAADVAPTMNFVPGRGPMPRIGGAVVPLTVLAWLPPVISWVSIRNPNESTWSFRLWIILFVAINAAAMVGYFSHLANTVPGGLIGFAVVHALALGAIVPLAKGPWPTDS
jgi:hypothetical protein